MREPLATPEVLAQLDATLRGMNRRRDDREAKERVWYARAAASCGARAVAVLTDPDALARACRDGYPREVRRLAHQAASFALQAVARGAGPLAPDGAPWSPLEDSSADPLAGLRG